MNQFSVKYGEISLNKEHFFDVFHDAWLKAVESKTNVQKGFQCTGIVPFDPDAIRYEKIPNPKKMKGVFGQNVSKNICILIIMIYVKYLRYGVHSHLFYSSMLLLKRHVRKIFRAKFMRRPIH